MPDLAAAPSPEGAEHEAADERRDETGAADRIGDAEGEPGAGQRHDLEPGATDVPVPTGDHDDARGGDARNHPGQDAVADLLEHQPSGGPVADRSRLGLRDRQHDPEQRHADPVVEAALDVQSLANSARQPRQRDDRLAERGVRRREDHREEQRLGPRGARETRRERATNPATSVSGSPIPSRRSGTESSPRSARTSIREASANRTSASVASASSLTVSPAGADLDQPQRLRADEQPDGGEHHRGGDRRARDPAGDRREREQSQRDNGERPVHGRADSINARSRGNHADRVIQRRPSVPPWRAAIRRSRSSPTSDDAPAFRARLAPRPP